MGRRVLIAGSNIHLMRSLVTLHPLGAGGQLMVVLPSRAGVDPDLFSGADARTVGPRDELRRIGVAGPIDEVWFLPSGPGSARSGRASRTNVDMTRTLRDALAWLGCAEFNLVGQLPPDQEQAIDQACVAAGTGMRVLRCAPVVGGGLPMGKLGQPGLPDLLAAVCSVRDHVLARSPDYFQRNSLRLAAPEDAALNLVNVDTAAAELCALARWPQTLGSRCTLAASKAVPLEQLCWLIGQSCELDVRVVRDEAILDAIDLLLRERLGGFVELFAAPTVSGSEVICSSLNPDGAALSELIKSFPVEWHKRCQIPIRAPALIQTPPLVSYYVSGTEPPPLVVVNAFGQGSGYWLKIIDELLPRRVILSQTRTYDQGGEICGLLDQVDDLAAVIHNEGIDKCHLIGWCTGGKVALRYYLKWPDKVISIAFLNASFKHDGNAPDLDTDYERELEAMSRIITRRPSTAGRIRRLLSSTMFEPPAERVHTAVDVLATTHPALADERRGPFTQERTLISYAAQLLEFWSHDMIGEAQRVHIPVLFLAGQLDRIISVDAQRSAAEHFPDVRVKLISAGGHYCMYDHPQMVADLITDFCDMSEARVRGR